MNKGLVGAAEETLVDRFLEEERPTSAQVEQVERFLSSRFTTTTKLLLGLARFYEESESGDCRQDNQVAAEMLRGFAREFAALERETL